MGWLQEQCVSKGRFGKKAGEREELQMPFFFVYFISIVVFVVSFSVLVLCVCVCYVFHKQSKKKLFILNDVAKAKYICCIKFTFISLNSSVVPPNSFHVSG